MLDINFDPFPILKSERFCLRLQVEADIPALFAMRSNPEVMRYVARPTAKTLEDAAAVFQMIKNRIEQNEGINWAISPHDSTDYLGIIGIFRIEKDNHRGEIGYMLPPQYWNQNIISEVIPIVLKYGFETLKLHSVEATIAPENGASRRVLEKNDFVQEAHFRENFFYNGQFLDTAILSILNPNR